MKYKVGDKVRVKSKDWYDENKDIYGNVSVKHYFTTEMSKWCGEEVIIEEVIDDLYRIKNDEDKWSWSDEMFEETVEQTGQRKFKCKDEVIVRYNKPGCCWFYGIVSDSNDEGVVLSGGFRHPYAVYDVLPYEGNENLIGKTDYPESNEVLLKKGELVYGFDKIEQVEDADLFLGKFRCIENKSIFVNNCPYSYCIPFSKLNLYDLEATKKEILTVKNGKLVKANV